MNTKKDIEWAAISRHRGELMGLAILFVVLFHVGLPRTDMFFGLKRMGNIGVDIFFFLSGMGLWFSWMKNPSTLDFYKRRLLRIYPTWLLIAGTFYIWKYLTGGKFSANIIDLIGDITINWDFWLHDELTFWYIPATLMLYLWAPFYMELIRRHPVYRWLPVAMIMWCVAVQWVTPIHQTVGHIEIFWSRVPIFFIGINAGELIRRKERLDGSAIGLILVLFVMSLAMCIWLEQMKHGNFPLFVERMLYIPLTVTTLLLLSHILDKAPQWLLYGLSFVGALSLEIYLIHSQFILPYISRLHAGYWLTAVMCIFATLPIAWVVQKLVNTIVKLLTPNS